MADHPPAGWYPDVRQPGTQRYWDGSRWTDQTAPGGGQPTWGAPAAPRPTWPTPGAPTAGWGAPASGPAPPSRGATAASSRPGTGGALGTVLGWTRRHKIVSVLLVLLVVASCSALLVPDEPQDDRASRRPPAESSTPTADTPPSPTSPTSSAPPTSAPASVPTPTPTSTPTPVPPVPVLSPEQERNRRWRAAYVTTSDALYARVARAVPGFVAPTSPRKALTTCLDVAAAMPWPARVRLATRRWGLAGGAAGTEQARGIFAAVTTTVCPDQRRANRVQSAANPKPPPAPAPAPAPPAPPPVSVYFANCTEVRAAGAAPIYAGDPGYSRDLDRDGDGVACET